MDRHGRIRSAALVALLVLGLTPALARGGAAAGDPRILTSPPRILASIAPGGASTASLVVVNQARSSESVLVRVADLAPDPDGASFGVVTDVGDAPRGAGAWISVQNPTLTLGPGEQRTVPITIRVPEDADAGGHYGAVVVETAPAEGPDDPVRVRVRLVTHVNVLVPGNVRYDASIGDLRVDRVANGRLRVRATFENDGNIQTTPQRARIVVSGPGGSRRAQVELPETIPDGSRSIDERVAIPSPAGRFRTRIELELEDGSKVRSRSVEIVAWRGWVPRAMLAITAIVLLAAAIPFVRRRIEFRRLVRDELERMESSEDQPDELPDGPNGPPRTFE